MQPVKLNQILRDLELDYIKKALHHSNDSVSKAATLLGIKRTALYMRLAALHISFKAKKKEPNFSFKADKPKIKGHPNLRRHKNDLEGTP